MKKVLKWLGICIGGIIGLIIIAGIVIMFVVDEEMVASQMESALHRHVTLGELNVGILSALSGIEIKEVMISNYKTVKQLEALKGKPVAKNDLFVGLKAFNFKLRFLPLLTGKFVLKELVLYEPVINVEKYKSGAYNYSDLLKPSAKEEKPVKPEIKEEGKSEPFTADNLPVEINIGKVGIEKAQLKYDDKGMEQTFQVYDLTALVHSIDINPGDLEKHDSVGLDIQMGVKTVGAVKSGSVQSFDLGLKIDGRIIPFDKKTRIANPEIRLKAGLPYGTMTGLQIFEKMKSIESLQKYCGKLDFLKKDIKWKDAFVNVWYKDGTVKLTDGKVPTDDYLLTYEGKTNINTKAMDMNMDMLLADKHQKSIRSGIDGNVKKAITGKAKQYVKPEKVTDIAMNRISNKEGKVYLKYKITGTMSKPDAKLVHPELPSIKDLLKDAAGDIADAAKDKAKDAAKEAADKAADKGKEKAAQKADKAKDKLKGKLGF